MKNSVMCFFIIFLFLFSCNSKKDYSKIKNIDIYKLSFQDIRNPLSTKNEKIKICSINNKDSINLFMSHFENKRKEPSIFMRMYEIDISYGDSVSVICGNGKFIRIDGASYIINENIEDIVNEFK